MTALIGVGLDLGDTAADLMHLRTQDADAAATCKHGVAAAWYLPLYLPTAVALCVQANAHRSQWPHMVFIGMAALAVSVGLTLTRNATAAAMSNFAAARLVGLLANKYADRTGQLAVGGAAMGVFGTQPARCRCGRHLGATAYVCCRGAQCWSRTG